jgi:hypothetical protein
MEKGTEQQQVDLNHTHELNERTKELKCLYGTFSLFNKMDVSLEKILQEVVDLIPSGLQFPEIACAKLMIADMEYRSERYMLSNWILTATIVANKKQVGVLEIAYTEKREDCFKGPFLEEEVFLLEAVASLIGQSIQRKALEDEKIKLYEEIKINYEKILSGFILICSSCKSICDEEGTWHQLEAYVQKKTNAKFSHGICPVCLKKLYSYLEED